MASGGFPPVPCHVAKRAEMVHQWDGLGLPSSDPLRLRIGQGAIPFPRDHFSTTAMMLDEQFSSVDGTGGHANPMTPLSSNAIVIVG